MYEILNEVFNQVKAVSEHVPWTAIHQNTREVMETVKVILEIIAVAKSSENATPSTKPIRFRGKGRGRSLRRDTSYRKRNRSSHK